jgi:two-component system, LytTR family, response regulator LytT
MMKIFIIEDETKAAKELERILFSLDSHIEITGIADSVEASIAFLTQHAAPDLIFSDIQLADSICFEIFNRVKVKSPIVFCTAFDEYLMEAFDTNTISYILKPINVKKVAAALDKFKEMKSVFEPEQNYINLKNVAHELKLAYKNTLLVTQGDKIMPIPVKNIAFTYLDKTIVKITTFNHERYFFASSLDEVERMLDPSLFYRANRQFIINRKAVVNVEHYLSRRFTVKLSVETPETIVISKGKASEFLQWLEG